MEEHLSTSSNDRLMNLMTIARAHEGSEYDLAVVNELLHGSAILLVPAKPDADTASNGEEMTLLIDAPSIDGVLTLYAYTGEAALRGSATGDVTCLSLPSVELMRTCIREGVGAILLDPDTPNELCVNLMPPQAGEN